MQQRYYDPQIGRFLSVDPVAARPIGDNFNRYSHAANNPYRFTDPDGREIFAGSHFDRWGSSSVKSYVFNPADVKASEQGAKGAAAPPPPNTKHQHQTPNTKHQTPNTKHQTPNTKHQSAGRLSDPEQRAVLD